MSEICEYTAVVARDDEIDKLPKRITCPECGKRVKPAIHSCLGGKSEWGNMTPCCIWAFIPRHRKPVGGKKFVRKNK
jgi:hypothetical protein